jgi:transposase-like protein
MARRGQRDGGKERFWRQALRQWQRSGLTVRAYCGDHGVSEPSFYAWRRIIAERDRQRVQRRSGRPGDGGQGDGQPVFVPVRVGPEARAALEVVLDRGRVVRVPPGFDAATLRQLLALLEEPSC